MKLSPWRCSDRYIIVTVTVILWRHVTWFYRPKPCKDTALFMRTTQSTYTYCLWCHTITLLSHPSWLHYSVHAHHTINIYILQWVSHNHFAWSSIVITLLCLRAPHNQHIHIAMGVTQSLCLIIHRDYTTLFTRTTQSTYTYCNGCHTITLLGHPSWCHYSVYAH